MPCPAELLFAFCFVSPGRSSFFLFPFRAEPLFFYSALFLTPRQPASTHSSAQPRSLLPSTAFTCCTSPSMSRPLPAPHGHAPLALAPMPPRAGPARRRPAKLVILPPTATFAPTRSPPASRRTSASSAASSSSSSASSSSSSTTASPPPPPSSTSDTPSIPSTSTPFSPADPTSPRSPALALSWSVYQDALAARGITFLLASYPAPDREARRRVQVLA
ncbi:hypothetical protein K488DRAFT_82215 [Vararia minispora EC-137]|uniref:Uncharacterized protein n=1 Tax=Vararia minispora EC-137 TaxID=1314806 RepID=A0ACB8QXG5_9AGAM|nr:hypothetical protein K488DRAFT_82215 [Vararia minispora EC-137]